MVDPSPAAAQSIPGSSASDIERMIRRAVPGVSNEVIQGVAILAAVIATLVMAAPALAQVATSDKEAKPGQPKTHFLGTRQYMVVLPANYDAGKTYPIMIGFGGWQHDAATARSYEKLEDAAKDTIVVYAQGEENAWGGAPYARTTVGQDVNYIRDVIADVAQRYNGDADRVTAVGLSNGGGMAAALACHAPDTVKAVASVAGAFYDPTVSGCASGAVPTLIIHGTADDIVSYNGGIRHGATYRSVNAVFDTFRAKNGCSDVVAESRNGSVVTTRAEGCAADTELQTVRLGGHTWFASNPSATSETVAFLQRFV